MSPMAPVTVVEPEQTRRDVQALLDDLGMTLDELRAEAAAGRFRSEDAALAWFAISGVVGD